MNMEAQKEGVILVKEKFACSEINQDPKYVRVGRVMLKSATLSIEVDINFDLFPMEAGKNYEVILTHSFLPEYKTNFKYAMYGKIFKIDLEAEEYQSVYISYGGLVMKLHGKLSQMSQHIVNLTRCYFLIRQVR